MALSTLNRPCTALATQTRAKAAVPLSRAAPNRLRAAPIVAFLGRGDKSSQSSAQDKKKVLNTKTRAGIKKPVVQPLGKAPTNSKENAESVLWFVLVGGAFLTGVLFVSIPALQVGGTAFTNTWQKGVNKSAGIKVPGDAGPGYAPGPGPAAAPGSPATKM